MRSRWVSTVRLERYKRVAISLVGSPLLLQQCNLALHARSTDRRPHLATATGFVHHRPDRRAARCADPLPTRHVDLHAPVQVSEVGRGLCRVHQRIHHLELCNRPFEQLGVAIDHTAACAAIARTSGPSTRARRGSPASRPRPSASPNRTRSCSIAASSTYTPSAATMSACWVTSSRAARRSPRAGHQPCSTAFAGGGRRAQRTVAGGIRESKRTCRCIGFAQQQQALRHADQGPHHRRALPGAPAASAAAVNRSTAS